MSTVAVLLCSWQTVSASQAVTDAERHQYEQRIIDLEQRITRLEKAVALLAPASAPTTTTELSPTEPTPVEPTPIPAPIPSTQTVQKRLGYEPPPELLPELGKIGAEVGLLLGGSANPFKLNEGGFAGAYINLPLIDRPQWLHGKVSYELSIGLSESKTKFNTTSNVAQVANLSLLNALFPANGLANATQALTGTGSAPFPVTTLTQTKLRLLQVVPFALKYSTNALDRWRITPYVVVGFGTYVTIHSQANQGSLGIRTDAQLPPAVLSAVAQAFGGQAPFGAPLVAGQLSQSPELEARGLPSGHGNIDFGLHTGGGIAIRLTRDLSLGFDARYNKLPGANSSFTTYGSRISLHF